MMRGSHHDAHLVGESWRFRIILIEVGSPHGRPEIVSLQAEQQFEDMAISLGIDATKLVGTPSAKRWPLIIDEDAAIFHLRFSIRISTWSNVEIIVMSDRRISHPIPRRHAYLTRQLVDAIDGTALVRAQDNQLSFICKNQIFLPFSFQLFALLGVSFCQLALAHGSHDDRSLVASCHGTKVFAKITHSQFYPRPIIPTVANGVIRSCQLECILRW